MTRSFKDCLRTLGLSLAVAASSNFAFAALTTEEETFFQNLQGCHRVTFNFIEDGIHNTKKETLLEWIGPHPKLKNGDFVIQHVAKAGTALFPHWRETWTKVDDSWEQVVAGPDGSLRYKAMGQIEMNQWEGIAENAPKPRRDVEAKRDYDFLTRRNTLQITPIGWVQNENNSKFKGDKLVSKELGWITYEKIAATECTELKAFLEKLP